MTAELKKYKPKFSDLHAGTRNLIFFGLWVCPYYLELDVYPRSQLIQGLSNSRLRATF